MKDKKKWGIFIIILIVMVIVVFYTWYSQREMVLSDPLWEEIYISGSGITVSGTVIYAKDKEFIIDVIREDAPTSRAPSLYIVSENSKIWQKNRWEKLKKAPKEGTLVMMYIPFSQEVAGLYVDERYTYVYGEVTKWDKETITVNKKQYDISNAYIENKANSREDVLAILSLKENEVVYAEIWPKELVDIPIIIEKAKEYWADSGFIPKDIDVYWHDGWIITGYQYPFKDRLNLAKRMFFSADGSEIVWEKEFLPFDELEMQVKYANKVYQNSFEQVLLSDLAQDKEALTVAGEDYRGEVYYYFPSEGLDVLYTKQLWDKDTLTVWKEVFVDGDPSGQ